MTAVSSPSWNLSRYVRATITGRSEPVSESATTELINQIGGNLLRHRHPELEGYDAETVRAILLDTGVTSPYPAEAPAKYAGR